MEDKCKTGRVTIPTDLDVVPETLEILKKWGADAIRDCDGTDFPQELKNADAKIYSTYYTTRKDNAWAKANPDEVQQCYIMTGFYTAPGETVTIPLMKGISPELMERLLDAPAEMLGKGRAYVRHTLAPGVTIGRHTHEHEMESMVIVSGRAVHIINGEEQILEKGDIIAAMPGDTHQIACLGDEPLVLIAQVLYE